MVLHEKIALYCSLAAKNCFCSVIFCRLLFFASTLNTYSTAAVTLRFLLHISNRFLCLTYLVLFGFERNTRVFFLQQAEAVPWGELERSRPPQLLLGSFFQFTQIQ